MNELKPLLGAIYTARVMLHGDYVAAMSALKSALDDPDVRSAAEARLKELDALHKACAGQMERRDFVGAQHRLYLKEALGK